MCFGFGSIPPTRPFDTSTAQLSNSDTKPQKGNGGIIPYLIFLIALIPLAGAWFFTGTLLGQDDPEVIASIIIVTVCLGVLAAWIFAAGIVLLVKKYDT